MDRFRCEDGGRLRQAEGNLNPENFSAARAEVFSPYWLAVACFSLFTRTIGFEVASFEFKTGSLRLSRLLLKRRAARREFYICAPDLLRASTIFMQVFTCLLTCSHIPA